MIIFTADHPLVLDGSHDREGYTPNERRAQQRRLSKGSEPMAKKAKKASKMDRKLASPDKPKRGRPRNVDLPGMEDRAIKPLEDIAASYAEVRDERMALNQREHELKVLAVNLMHKYQKTIYRRDGFEIVLSPGEETVKVRVKKPGEEAEPDTDGAPLEDHEAEADDESVDEADA